MKVELISIGDELLSGFIENRNAAYIGRVLDAENISVDYITTVGDDTKNIIDALNIAGNRASVIIATGGLGPTSDDMTRKAAAKYFDKKLIFNDEIIDSIREKFKMMDKVLTRENQNQAELPEGAEVISNTIGSAPGIKYKHKNSVFFFLPGVPSEMQQMLQDEVLPYLTNHHPVDESKQIILRTAGISESEVSSQIEKLIEKFPEITIAYLPQVSGVQVKLKVVANNKQNAKSILHKAEDSIREKLGRYIYGTGDETIEKIVAQLLFDRKLTVSVAESCTGGLISHKLTNIPGSSSYYKRGFITYTNTSKIALLNVAEETIKEFGAVSEQTAAEMADGVRKISSTDIGLSATGIAGPGGGTDKKPVGLVFLGCSCKGHTVTERYRFHRDRIWNKQRTAVTALDLLRRVLLDNTIL